MCLVIQYETDIENNRESTLVRSLVTDTWYRDLFDLFVILHGTKNTSRDRGLLFSK